MNAAVAFREHFGTDAHFRVTVPGRVNLIGDHIDYCGLPVLPAAIQKRVTMVARPRSDQIIRIVPPPPFEPRSFRLDEVTQPFASGDWGNYAKAAIAELYTGSDDDSGFDATLESDLPVAAGLSSSSAIVVAVALAFLHSNRRGFDPIQLAGRLAGAERYVGTRGGGMDQAVVLGAREGCALRIEFDPLRTEAVAIPAGWQFVVAHSGVSAEKSGAMQAAYNERTVDVQLALTAVSVGAGATGVDYRTLLDRFDRETLDRIAHETLDSRRYDRFMHVVSEADRVDAAVSAMRAGDMSAFGRLMSESHASLRDRFAVSVPALDALVDAFERGGASGARLTGAGFGGCVVALTHDRNATDLTASVKREFYGRRPETPEHERLIFAVEPAHRARVEPFTDAGAAG